MQITELTRDLAKQEKAGEYLAVIEGVRDLLSADPSAFQDPWIKGWVGRRWRDLFMQEAVKDSERPRIHTFISTSDIHIEHQMRNTREDVIQADLDSATRVLNKTQSELRQQRRRQVQLQARLAEGRRVLAARLVELYRADDPDLVTVILDSKGFAELLERGEFLRRISEQDRRVLTLVRSARVEATMAANRLDVLEKRQQKVAQRIQKRRDAVASVKARIVRVQNGYDDVRDERAAALAGVKEDRQEAETYLAKVQKEQQRISGVLNGVPTGPIRRGSGSMIWPLNGPITSPFCERRSWESCHPGIDIGAPTGTPIRAADSGRVALAAPTGGYGNFTCVQHSASLSTCYAHQSRFGASVGQNVSKGQVIGYVGSTGFSTGPHLHFEVRVNGAVTNPMSYL